MATYPALEVDTKGSDWQPVDAIDVDEWPDGSVRGRSYNSVGRYRWKLFHLQLSNADKATLKAFYDTNRLRSDISFVNPWDGVTYNNIMFTAVPKYEMDGGFWNVTVEMRQILP